MDGSRLVLTLEATGQQRAWSAVSARPLLWRHHGGVARVGRSSFVHVPVLAPNAAFEQGRSAPGEPPADYRVVPRADEM